MTQGVETFENVVWILSVHACSPKVLVAWWLLTAMVLTTAYRSSLAAALSVLSYPPPMNTFEDVLSRPGWVFGAPRFRGSNYLFFSESTDPIIQQISKGMEVRSGAVR